MGFNSHGSATRSHNTNRPSTRFRRNLSHDGELQYAGTKMETETLDDSLTYEKIGQEIDCHDEIQRNDIGSGEVGEHRKSHSFSNSQSIGTALRSVRKTNSRQIRLMHVPPCIAAQWYQLTGSKLSHLTNIEMSEPPVTITTLRELDLHSIQNNLNLRIDICHDPDLFFQPISGRKGDEKRSESRKYWSALSAEFQIYLHDAQTECVQCRQTSNRSPITFKPRLPIFFDNLREIVQMLVPDSDHEEVSNHLDTALLMQQVRVGALDAVQISEWLANLLTSHCAPMRDRTAHSVTEKIRNGTTTADMDGFVDGLETLFGLLEAMKLDIANHQIRSFRYHLIDGTVDFQRDCFSRAVENDQMDITKSRQWYRVQRFNHHLECGFDHYDEAAQAFGAFIHGLTQLCNPDEEKVPLTLQYDNQRIMRLREDLQDHIQMNLCLAVFNQQAQEIAGPYCDPSTAHNDLKKRIIFLTEDDDGNGGAISEYLDAIAVEITRAAFAMRPASRKANLPLNNFDFTRTSKLLRDVFRSEDEHQTVTKSFLVSLEARTMQYTERFRAMTSLEISNAQKQWAQTRAAKDVPLANWDEMARKLAHIGVIHWRIWADLCYDETVEDYKYSEQSSPILIEQSLQSTIEERLDQQLHVLPSSSAEHIMVEFNQHTAFERETAAMPKVGICIERQDSGFAEELDCVSVCEPDIELDLTPNSSGKHSPEAQPKNSGKQQLDRRR